MPDEDPVAQRPRSLHPTAPHEAWILRRGETARAVIARAFADGRLTVASALPDPAATPRGNRVRRPGLHAR